MLHILNRILRACSLLLLSWPTAVPAADAAVATVGVPAIADPGHYLESLTQAMQVKWPKNRTMTIVCHGHSVPCGYLLTTVDPFIAYPHLLHRALKERYPNAVINVIVTGIGGEHSVAGAARFQQQVLNHAPDLITIDYALNDRFIGLERSREAWASMITAATNHHVPVLLLTPTIDLTAPYADPQDPLARHAAQIRSLAAEYHVGLVDSFRAFHDAIDGGTKAQTLMASFNHPNRKGHELVVEALLRWFPHAP